MSAAVSLARHWCMAGILATCSPLQQRNAAPFTVLCRGGGKPHSPCTVHKETQAPRETKALWRAASDGLWGYFPCCGSPLRHRGLDLSGGDGRIFLPWRSDLKHLSFGYNIRGRFWPSWPLPWCQGHTASVGQSPGRTVISSWLWFLLSSA